MKKSETLSKLKSSGIDYTLLKKEFEISLKKGESILIQILKHISKKVNLHRIELMQIISPKNIIENLESKMVNSDLKEKIYESVKELSLINWKIRKAVIGDDKERLDMIKSAFNYCSKELLALRKELYEELINNWKKDEKKNNCYIS